MKSFLLNSKYFFKIIDFSFFIFLYPSAWLMKKVRGLGIDKLPRCKYVLLSTGVFPVLNHYYEPQFDFGDGGQSLENERTLPGINWNIAEQIDMLSQFSFASELEEFPVDKDESGSFYFNNATFPAGDAEYLYQLIRLKKPKRIIEIGSGNSTLMAINAIQRNKVDDTSYTCKHVCIEPYEMPWLEATNVFVIRKKVEDIELSYFEHLGANDILFIDSSHIIRPQGDVLFELLQLLPTLKKGVIVHVHDIFSPRNYPKQWLEDKVYFLNEQYLLEAFLTHNTDWKIIGALNFLKNNYFDNLKVVAPYLKKDSNPGSFYFQRCN